MNARLLSLCCVLLSACVSSHNVASPAVSGQIVAADNSAPIVAAQVTLVLRHADAPTERITVSTDALGKFAIAARPRWGVQVPLLGAGPAVDMINIEAAGFRSDVRELRWLANDPEPKVLGTLRLERLR